MARPEQLQRIVEYSLPYTCIVGFNISSHCDGYFYKQLVDIIARPSRQRNSYLIDFHQLFDLDEQADFSKCGVNKDKKTHFVDFILDELERHTTSSRINGQICALYINYPYSFPSSSQALRVQRWIARICLANASIITSFGFFRCNFQPDVEPETDNRGRRQRSATCNGDYVTKPYFRFGQPGADVFSLENTMKCISTLHNVVSLHVTVELRSHIYPLQYTYLPRRFGWPPALTSIAAMSDGEWSALRSEYSSNDDETTTTSRSGSSLRHIEFCDDTRLTNASALDKLCKLLVQACSSSRAEDLTQQQQQQLEQVTLVVCKRTDARVNSSNPLPHIFLQPYPESILRRVFPNALQVQRFIECDLFWLTTPYDAAGWDTAIQHCCEQMQQWHEQQSTALASVLAAAQQELVGIPCTMPQQLALEFKLPINMARFVGEMIEASGNSNQCLLNKIKGLHTLLTYARHTRGVRLEYNLYGNSEWKYVRQVLQYWTTARAAVANGGGGVLEFKYKSFYLADDYGRGVYRRVYGVRNGQGDYSKRCMDFVKRSEFCRKCEPSRNDEWLKDSGLILKREFRPIITALNWNRRVLRKNGNFDWPSTAYVGKMMNLADAYCNRVAAAYCSKNITLMGIF